MAAEDGEDLRVELWRAPTVRQESWDRRPVVVTRPGPARFVRAHTPRGDEFVVGHHDAAPPAGDHQAWTTPRDGEDVQLSRHQLHFSRTDAGWRVEVPEPSGSKREVSVQYWASANTDTLVAGGGAELLDPSTFPCLVVPTDTAFYWVLVTSGPAPPRVLPGTVSTPGGRSRTNVLAGQEPVTSRLPGGWKEAIQIKFAPFLSWPMGWRPAPVDPKAFTDPASGVRVPPAGRPALTRKVRETKEYAIAHGYRARDAYGATEVEMLSWLVRHGVLSFEDRLEWHDPAPAEPAPH